MAQQIHTTNNNASSIVESAERKYVSGKDNIGKIKPESERKTETVIKA